MDYNNDNQDNYNPNFGINPEQQPGQPTYAAPSVEPAQAAPSQQAQHDASTPGTGSNTSSNPAYSASGSNYTYTSTSANNADSAYRPADASDRSYTYTPSTASVQAAAKTGMPTWLKALLIILGIIIFAVIVGASCSRAIQNTLGSATATPVDEYTYSSDYIGVVYLEGTIADGESGDGYNHNWILSRVNQMATDPLNKGLLLFVETPGGSAYASRELYLELLNYKESTGRPFYVYMGSQATSGGYYVSAPANKIYANEECWTGSIGVIISGLLDISGLMEKYGVKSESIVSGRNKDMGSMYKPMTDEERAILQSLVDDSFDRFVQAVVDGRGLPESRVRELADGRIYTATQAVENGLIDSIGTIDDAITDMQSTYSIQGAQPQLMQYTPPTDLRSYLGFNGFGKEGSTDSIGSDLSALVHLMESADQFELMCIAPIRK